MPVEISKNLDDNMKYIESCFEGCADAVMRRLFVGMSGWGFMWCIWILCMTGILWMGFC